MRLSHSHKFIFVHIPKTAGQTVQKVLNPYCIEPETNKTLFRRILTNLPVRENVDKAFFRPHYSANWIKTKVGQQTFSQYKTFAFIRNPFDLLVSRYEFILRRKNHHRHTLISAMNFSQYLEYERARHQKNQKDLFSFVCDKSGNIIVDELFRFEDLSSEINRMCAFLNIEQPSQIAHIHKSERKPYQEYYSDSDIAVASKIFERDIQHFDYKF